MLIKEYLLDSNIIIKIWQEYPLLLGYIENHESLDFKVYEPKQESYTKKNWESIMEL